MGQSSRLQHLAPDVVGRLQSLEEPDGWGFFAGLLRTVRARLSVPPGPVADFLTKFLSEEAIVEGDVEEFGRLVGEADLEYLMKSDAGVPEDEWRPVWKSARLGTALLIALRHGPVAGVDEAIYELAYAFDSPREFFDVLRQELGKRGGGAAMRCR